MIRAELHFINGIVKLNLIGDNSEEKQLLDIATQGRTVKDIGNLDKGVVMTLQRSEKKESE